ncbi:MAG: type II CRISPR RNA-guided endonuclease Cas9 [Prevotella sp.]|nr:type II CRISPR RNA-guided endonuclease Cas9 [Prevotella sp.]
MKTILGLDLGTTSIGWALVKEAENKDEKSSIISLGARVIPLTTDEKSNFEKGKAITTNADRTLKRSIRRGNQRFKLRRDNLKSILLREGWITNDTILAERGNKTTFETLRLRAKAAVEEISLEELARVLLMINKKRGYKSNRKTDNSDEGQFIDGLAVAKELISSGKTPGQYVLENISQNNNFHIPDFYRSDLIAEFEAVWKAQSEYYPDELTDTMKDKLYGKDKRGTWVVCKEYLNLVGIKRDRKGKEQEKENYEWRVKALSEKIGLEELSIVFQELNNQIQKSASYLGKISDRHKELYLNNMTVGQYLVSNLDRNPNFSLKNTVFYRNDYIEEFEKIWNKQVEFHKELTDELKKEIGKTTIFYQRPLRSQKGLVSLCEFESGEKEVVIDGKRVVKTIGLKACPKSSPLFQEFKIWQILNNITINDKALSQEQKDVLFRELNRRQKMSKAEVLKLLGYRRGADINYENLEGNSTNAAFFNAYCTILVNSGHDRYDPGKEKPEKAYKIIEDVFSSLGYKTGFLYFDACKEGNDFQNQPAYKLWHLIYSYEGDNSTTGVDRLVKRISEITGFPEEHAKILAQITFKPDYGNLSSKAIRKIMPNLKKGYKYSEACELAGYRHSKSSLTKEELDNKELKEHLDLLPKNSLRNPVVEKILNQMVNVVNSVIDTYGKLDEVRIELARELKKSAKERQEMTVGIANANKQNEQYKKEIQEKFGIPEPSRNDILKYKLYKELESLGYKTLYSNTCIHPQDLFSGNFDIEHIIPQAKLFDDSFSNKTIETRKDNLAKSNMTACDYVKSQYGEQEFEQYENRVKDLYSNGIISKAKYDHLLMTEAEIPDGFIDRDLRDTQYIARKAKSMLEEIVRDVVSTTGAITDRLREDWQLINVMQELNWDKYDKLGLTETHQDKDGRRIPRIKNWTKRNDHRHHAMDALVIAFTKRSYIQYLNNLNARTPKGDEYGEFVDLSEVSLSSLPFEERQRVVRMIENTQLMRDDKKKLRFIPPMPVDEFRAEAKKHLANCLVSIKSKNKVVTRNVNKFKKSGSTVSKVQLTPRGQLHNETIYGKIDRYETKEEKVGSAFDMVKISSVANKSYREALSKRLREYDNNPKKAFTGKNSLEKKPIYIDESHLSQVPIKVKTVQLSSRYTIRKPIDRDLQVDKVVDEGIKRILQARLEKYGNDATQAFSNLDQNPIWLNEEKGIQIKRVKIFGVANAESIHEKRDNVGNKVLDVDGNLIPNDYVSTSNNHHIAIFQDESGNLHERVVSFYEAVERGRQGLPIIEKVDAENPEWKYLFSMKQNEYFVFPNEETNFNPEEIDLLNPENYELISPNLYRVQKLATGDYVFRHHLETTVENVKELRNTTWKRINNANNLKGAVKVRLNHIGQIVSIGE